jgi:hypothetical protein
MSCVQTQHQFTPFYIEEMPTENNRADGVNVLDVIGKASL